MNSPEFMVDKIVAVSFGSDGKHKPYLIVEDPQGERVFIPAESLGQNVGEIDAARCNVGGKIILGSVLQVEVDENNGTAKNVSQIPSHVPQVRSPVS